LPTSTNLEHPAGPPQIEGETLPPIWLQRASAVVYVFFCIIIGLYLIVLPWANWFPGGFTAQWPLGVQHVLHSGFVRGAVSGLGVVDIWLGILEAVNYRDRR
jgi:hypothetical protein